MSKKPKLTFNDAKRDFTARGYLLLSDESEYQNTHSKLRYMCPRHLEQGEMLLDYGHLRSGRGCYYCGRDKTGAAHRIEFDHETYARICKSKGFIYQDAFRKNGQIYIHFICANRTEMGIQEMLLGGVKKNRTGCVYCHHKNVSELYILNKMKEINPNEELLEPYVNMTTPSIFLCHKHNFKHRTTVQNVINGRGCYYCGLEKLSKYRTLSDEEIIRAVHAWNPHVDLIEYKGSTASDSRWYCNKHHCEFTRHISSLKARPSGCDLCVRENNRRNKTMGIDEFKRRLKLWHPDVVVLSDYENNSTPMQFKCLKHNCEFVTTASNILARVKCCDKSKITYREEKMCSLLEEWGFTITRQKSFCDCVDKRSLPFDAYLDEYQIAIEYDGEQHFYPVLFGGEAKEESLQKFAYIRRHDQIKTQYCIDNKIALIRIPYFKCNEMRDFLFQQLVYAGAIKLLTQ